MDITLFGDETLHKLCSSSIHRIYAQSDLKLKHYNDILGSDQAKNVRLANFSLELFK